MEYKDFILSFNKNKDNYKYLIDGKVLSIEKIGNKVAFTNMLVYLELKTIGVCSGCSASKTSKDSFFFIPIIVVSYTKNMGMLLKFKDISFYLKPREFTEIIYRPKYNYTWELAPYYCNLSFKESAFILKQDLKIGNFILMPNSKFLSVCYVDDKKNHFCFKYK
jgi:hypothetical protein